MFPLYIDSSAAAVNLEGKSGNIALIRWAAAAASGWLRSAAGGPE